MKKLVAIIFIALLCTVVWAGMQKTIYTQYDIIVLQPDSLMRFKADVEIWGNLWLVSSDTTDTANMTPDVFTIDTIDINTISDSFYCSDEVVVNDTIWVEYTGGAREYVKISDVEIKILTGSSVHTNILADSIFMVGVAESLSITSDNLWFKSGTITADKATLDTIDVDLFTGEGMFDDKICFNDTVMLGDSADKIILPKGSVIELYDTTDTHKMQIYQTSTTSKIVSPTNKLIFESSNIYLGEGDTLFITSATSDTYNLFSSAGNLIIKGDGDFGLDLATIAFDIDGNDSTLTFNWGKNAYFNMDTISYQLEWTGSGGIKAAGADFTGNLWLLGDTLFFTDGGADTGSIIQDGTNLKFNSDNDFLFNREAEFNHNIRGINNDWSILWSGWKLLLDYNNDDALALISFHNEDSIKVDTSDHVMEWTGSGGIKADDAEFDDSTFIIDATNNRVGIMENTPLCYLDIPGLTTNSSVKIGAFEIQSYAVNNCWLCDNIYYDGNFKYRSNGFGGLFSFLNGEFMVKTAPTGTAGNTATLTCRINAGSDGRMGIGGNISTASGNYTGSIIYIHSDGNVGIDTIVPAEKLHVNGNALIEDTLTVNDVSLFQEAIDVSSSITSSVSDTVASATTITLGNYNNFVITGISDIDSIDTAGAFPNWTIAYIQFTGSAGTNGIVDGKNLKIAGDFAYTADDILVLQRRGNIFYQITRSVN